MNLYSRILMPRLIDWVMSGPPFPSYRQTLLAAVKGKVLEIGFGTGLNLPYYPEIVESITTIDPNPGMKALAQRRIAASSIPVNCQVLRGEQLPFPDNHFDSAVTTWTLCSIAQVEQALTEIYRVLKPGGQFFFIEHGLSEDPEIQVWQRRLTPLQKIIGDGCHLDRDIGALVHQHFAQVHYKTFYAEQMPRVGAYFYQGVAQK